MRISTILFDLDGTLIDTLDDLTASVNTALQSLGFPARTRSEVLSFVGNGIAHLVRSALPDGADESFDACSRAFYAHYLAHMNIHTAPYPGIVSLLERLRARGIKTGVISNKAHDAAVALCHEYFPGLIDIVIGERPDMPKKPAPDGIFAAMRALDATASCTLYAGDSDVDVQTAHNAGLKCLAVSWGFRSREVLTAAGADAISDSAEEFEAILDALDQ